MHLGVFRVHLKIKVTARFNQLLSDGSKPLLGRDEERAVCICAADGQNALAAPRGARRAIQA